MSRRTAFTFCAWLLSLALCALVIWRTPFHTDLSAFLPASPDPEQRVLIEQLQEGAASRLLLVAVEGGDAAQRAEASRRLAATLRASGRFEQVQNGEREGWEAVGTWLHAHRYQLSPAVTPERFTPEGLRDAIDETLSLLGTPAGAAVKPLLESDPTGETQRIVEDLLPAQAPRLEHGVWVSRVAPRALLLAGTRAAGGDIDGQVAAADTVRQAFAALGMPGLRLEVSGPGVFAQLSRDQVVDEVIRLAIEGTLLVGALLLLAFGTLRALAVAALPVVSGVAAGVAAVGLVFGGVHGITLGFGSTLIGEAVDYAIYFLVQARASLAAGAAPGQGWRHWLATQWPTVRLGAVTSVCGFVVLAFSGFPGLAQLGVFSVAGLAAAAATARFVLPVLMPDGAAGSRLRAPLVRGLGQVLAWLPRLRWAGWALGAAALTVLLGLHGTLWRGDLLSLSPVPPAALALDARLRADLGTSDARTLVLVRAPALEDALQGAEAAASRLDGLVAQGLISGYDTPTRLLPSRATQAARQASLPDAATLRAALAAATEGGPLPASRLAAFVDAVEQARRAPAFDLEALDAPDAARDALRPLLGTQVLHQGGQWSVLIALHPSRDEVVTDPVRAALQGLPGVLVVDIKRSLDALYATYLREALGQALIGAAAVLLLLGLRLRSPRRLLGIAQPLALAVLLTLGGLALAGVGLGILHLVGVLLVVALGSNYALFFDHLAHDEPAREAPSRRHPPAPQASRTAAASAATSRAGALHDEETLASLLFANLTAVGAFGLIALSKIPALSAVGQVVAPGALLALLLSAVYTQRRAR